MPQRGWLRYHRLVSGTRLGEHVFRFEIRLDEKSDWVKVFDPRDSTVFVAADDPPNVGEEARVDMCIGAEGEGPKVILRGQVISRRLQSEGPLAKGFSVALGPQEREKINYLNGFVRGGLLNLRERRRLPLRLPVRFGGVSGPVNSFTRDINEEGIFIVSEDPLPEDSEIHVLLTFPGQNNTYEVSGVVSHTVVVEDEDVPGMGVRLTLSEEQSKEFSQMIDDLESRFMRGELPDETLL